MVVGSLAVVLAATSLACASSPPSRGAPAAALSLVETGLQLHADGKTEEAVAAMQEALELAPHTLQHS